MARKRHRVGAGTHQIPRPPRNLYGEVILLRHGTLSGVEYALYTTPGLDSSVYASLYNPVSDDRATEYGETEAEAMKRTRKAARQLRIQEDC